MDTIGGKERARKKGSKHLKGTEDKKRMSAFVKPTTRYYARTKKKKGSNPVVEKKNSLRSVNLSRIVKHPLNSKGGRRRKSHSVGL